MIGKIKKGKSFGGCIRYVMGKDNAKIIASDGFLPGTNKEMIDSFNCQCLLNPKIKQPLGHIALSFKREDAPRLTDEFMAKIALEYMQLMEIKNTQFILVRHHNTDNPHCHLVYNRINYDGKVISSQNDFKCNEIATKKLKDKYGLTYAEDKSKTNVKKLHDPEWVKYEIHNAVKATLEDIFELNRNNQNIEQMREDVETYEEAVRKQATLAEQARLKEQAAKEQESKAMSIKNKQDNSKVKQNKSKP